MGILSGRSPGNMIVNSCLYLPALPLYVALKLRQILPFLRNCTKIKANCTFLQELHQNG